MIAKARYLALILAGAGLLTDCHRVASVPSLEPRLSEVTCHTRQAGLGRLDVIRAARPDPRLSSSSRGSLVIRVTVASRGETRVLPRASVDVFQGSLQAPRFALTVRTDSLGWARADSLSTGVFEVRVLKVGYAVLRDQLQLRVGFVDTLHAQLRTNAVCLAPVTTGALPNLRWY